MDILKKIDNGTVKLAIIGLGYVGLPLAVEFGKKFKTVGLDINLKRINELRSGHDHTLETTPADLKQATALTFTDNINEIVGADIYIVTVPTPIDKHCQPDLTPLYKASEAVGKVLAQGNIVIYESTVFPGCTEEECVPILAQTSGLTFNKDFFCGYSPARINPGDKQHNVSNILKITSGSTPAIGDVVDTLYKTIVTAGTHQASCLKIAEAAKVIENSQRDLNIAFVNELAKIFNLIGIDTLEVLEAAGTKWNFLPFRPGLVGGHCIGVDPYYLTHKAQEIGYHPEIILAGRRLNDGMGDYVASEVVKLMIKKEHVISKAKVLVLGITFKENCPDIRNSRAIDVVRGLEDFGCIVDVYDPWAETVAVKREYDIELVNEIAFEQNYDAVVLAVAHQQFKELDLTNFIASNAVVYDIKYCLPKNIVDSRL